MYHGKQYAFYHHPEKISDEPLLYKNLIASAKNRVEIWDPYFNDADTMLFSHLQDNVKVKVLLFNTKELFGNRTATRWGLSTRVQLSGKNGVEVYFGCVDKGNHTYKEWEWHDRWLIIDERVFLIGSSISNYLLPNHTTGICELTAEEDKDLVKEMFKKYWKTAVVGCGLKYEVI